jgi:hypothetical protein
VRRGSPEKERISPEVQTYAGNWWRSVSGIREARERKGLCLFGGEDSKWVISLEAGFQVIPSGPD